ncbi:MAG TPA: YqzL family protein [Clostridiales bacterium]|nr:YqzL family protein [Clostridiales bacterium]
MKELMWRIFENSGHIESYLLYKGFIDCQGEKNEEADNEDSAHAGDSPKVL